jgi:diguanylate cyclase (GGDEF)-like protein
MINHVFQNMVLSEDKHLILSRFSEEELYGYIHRDMFLSFEDRLIEEDRSVFLDHVNQKDHQWFFVHLNDTHDIIALKYQYKNMEGIHFLVAKGTTLLETSEKDENLVECYAGLASIYGDVYFMLDAKRDYVYVQNGGVAQIKPGIYTVDEFKQILSMHVKENQKEEMSSMFDDMILNVSRGCHTFEGNLVDNDDKVLNTIINFCTITHHDHSVSAIGNIHAERERTVSEASTMERDGLTGLYSKKEIEKIARSLTLTKDGRAFTIGIIDVDFFKNVNDTYGHATGDAVLQKVGLIIQTEVGSSGYAGRFGGDEFFVIINTVDEKNLRLLFSSIHTQVSNAFPTYGPGAGRLTLSIGSACYPVNSTEYDSLFFLADHCLYIAKKKGRDRYVIYTPAKHGTVEEIMRSGLNSQQIANREDQDPAEMLINMYYRYEYGEKPSLETILKEFCVSNNVQDVMIATGSPFRITHVQTTSGVNEIEKVEQLSELLNTSPIVKDTKDFMLVSSVDYVGLADPALKECLQGMNIESFVLLRFKDMHDQDALFLMASVGKKQKWSSLYIKYYRIFTNLLKKYDL